jgi:lysylphosphatidylglycerol synthetase-like protein (DUF2156 family)
MKKITLFGNERTTLELAALFVFILVLVANLVVIRFTEGYLGYYGIPIAEVNYVPQIYDYLRIALPVIIGSIIITVVVLCLIGLSVYIGNLLAKLTKPSKSAIKYVRRHGKFFKGIFNIFGLLIKVSIWAVCILVLWSALYTVSANTGKTSAENTTRMTSISKSDDNLQKVIIYKGDNELILKTYDTSKKEFVDSYSVIVGADYSARMIDL